ncbi:hypothetical protein ACKFKG_15580 [Phormidesmis sp. 146-35]
MNRSLRAITIVAISLFSVTLPDGVRDRVRAQSSPPQSALDKLTDHYFYRVNVGLRRKIRSGDSIYIQEWQAIQIRLKGNLIENGDCGDGKVTFQWVLPIRLLDSVADGVLYSRYPNLKGRKIRGDETSLISEWNSIRQAISEVHQCY